MHIKAILLMTCLLTACAGSPEDTKILWQEPIKLPKNGTQANLGVAGPLVGIIKGQLLVAAGANFPNGLPWDGGKKAYQKTAYLYTIAANELQLSSEFTVAEEIAYSANYSDGTYLYAAGGENQKGLSDQVFKFTLDNQDKLVRDTLPALPIALTNAGLVGIDQQLYVIGGEQANAVSDQVYILQAGEGTWETYLTLPYPISHAVVLSNQQDRIYIAGGRKRNPQAKSDMYTEILEVDLLTKTIKTIAQLPTALAAGTGLYLKGQILLFGGDDALTFHQVEEAIAKIDNASDPEGKERLIAAKNLLQAKHPGFRQQVIAFDLETQEWENLGNINGPSPVTTTAVLQDSLILIPSGEIRAGVRTDQILIGRVK